MTSIFSLNKAENRRQKLHNQRRVKFCQETWRLFFLGGSIGGLSWLMMCPSWVIHQKSQIEIRGNQLLLANEIRSKLPLTYPQSLLQISNQQLEDDLTTNSPLAYALVNAQVNRHLLPSSKLLIEIQERTPVAVVVDSSSNQSLRLEIGLLDELGIVIPYQFYQQQHSHLDKPLLTVIGFQQQHQTYWTQLYPLIKDSPVQIFEVNWLNPSNLILQTEMGTVYLGHYTDELPKQLAVLAELKSQNLPSQLNPGQSILYIDLTTPESPLIEVVESD